MHEASELKFFVMTERQNAQHSACSVATVIMNQLNKRVNFESHRIYRGSRLNLCSQQHSLPSVNQILAYNMN